MKAQGNYENMDLKQYVVDMLEKFSDDKGRVECRKALAVARNLNVSPLFVGRVATEKGYRISQCELAQFGTKKIGEFCNDVYGFLKGYADKNGKISCKNAYKVAARFGLFKVRSTIKNSDLDVVDCQLGCFTEKKKARLKLYVNLQLKSKNSGKTLSYEYFELLRQIKSSPTLCDVVHQLNISFSELKEKIAIIEQSLGLKCLKSNYNCHEKPYLTDEALTWLKKFELLQKEVEEFSIKRFKELFYGDRIYKGG